METQLTNRSLSWLFVTLSIVASTIWIVRAGDRAQVPVDFSGRWRLEGRSTDGIFSPLGAWARVIQTADSLNIDRTIVITHDEGGPISSTTSQPEYRVTYKSTGEVHQTYPPSAPETDAMGFRVRHPLSSVTRTSWQARRFVVTHSVLYEPVVPGDAPEVFDSWSTIEMVGRDQIVIESGIHSYPSAGPVPQSKPRPQERFIYNRMRSFSPTSGTPWMRPATAPAWPPAKRSITAPAARTR